MKDSLDQLMKKLKLQALKDRLLEEKRLKIKYETEAVTTIKEFITHRKSLNFKNDRKLAIYESKLKDKLPILSALIGK